MKNPIAPSKIEYTVFSSTGRVVGKRVLSENYIQKVLENNSHKPEPLISLIDDFIWSAAGDLKSRSYRFDKDTFIIEGFTYFSKEPNKQRREYKFVNFTPKELKILKEYASEQAKEHDEYLEKISKQNNPISPPILTLYFRDEFDDGDVHDQNEYTTFDLSTGRDADWPGLGEDIEDDGTTRTLTELVGHIHDYYGLFHREGDIIVSDDGDEKIGGRLGKNGACKRYYFFIIKEIPLEYRRELVKLLTEKEKSKNPLAKRNVVFYMAQSWDNRKNWGEWTQEDFLDEEEISNHTDDAIFALINEITKRHLKWFKNISPNIEFSKTNKYGIYETNDAHASYSNTRVVYTKVKLDISGFEPSFIKKFERHNEIESSKNPIPGGLAEGKSPSDFDPTELAKGTKVEMEHTTDPMVAQEIAMDHLTEDPDYYIKLAKIEKAGNPSESFIPPQSVADSAALGLSLRKQFGRGMTPIGVKRSIQLSRRDPVSLKTVKRMKAFFDRHAKNAWGFDGDIPKNGTIAWLGWGGDEGRDWVLSILKRQNPESPLNDSLNFHLKRAYPNDLQLSELKRLNRFTKLFNDAGFRFKVYDYESWITVLIVDSDFGADTRILAELSITTEGTLNYIIRKEYYELKPQLESQLVSDKYDAIKYKLAIEKEIPRMYNLKLKKKEKGNVFYV